MDQTLYVVRGRKILEINGTALRQAALPAARVVVDVGAGDGRWIYRLARAHPDWCCIGIDPNAAGMRECSARAARKPQRGGAPNAWFIRAAVNGRPPKVAREGGPASHEAEPEARPMNHARCVEEEVLPEALDSIADEIHVQYPWGSLRRMMLQPVPDGLARLARVGRPGAGFRFTLNLLFDDHALEGTELVAWRDGHLADSYARAGLVIDTMRLLVVSPQTSWGKRLGGGREAAVLAIAGWITAAADSGRKLAPGVSPMA